MSDPQKPANDGEKDQVDSPTMQESDSSDDHSDRMKSPQDTPQRAGGKRLGLTTLSVALCALGLSAWQLSQAAFFDDDADADGQPVIEDVTSGQADIEQSLSSQDQSLQSVIDQTSDRTSDRTKDDSPDRLVDSRVDNAPNDRRDDEDGNDLDNRLEPINRQINDLAGALDETNERINSIGSTVNTLQDAFTSSERQREDLAARIEQAAGLQREIDQELTLRLALLEAAALLRFGQTQAELARDYASAAAAFRQAQSRLASTADPRLGQTRQWLSAELEAIESSQGPEWTEAQLRLARLSDRIESWPLAVSNRETSTPDAQTDSSDGWWAGMKHSLGQLVEVERRDLRALDTEQVNALHEQLRQRIVAAELAIERRDMASVRQHLQHVDERIEQYFELSNPDVTEARVALDQIRSLRPAEPPADLGRALASLNQVLEAL